MGNRLRNSEKLTMDTIAKKLNVSKTTISRALSGKGRIGKETRSRILEYIELFGYKPNSFARVLAGAKTFNIGVVIPEDNERGDAPFFKECLVGVMEAVAKRDYDTVLAVFSDNNFSNLERLVENHKVDGIVLTRCDKNRKMIGYLKKNGMPFILIGHAKEDVLQMDSDQKDCCCELTATMLKISENGLAFMGGTLEMDVEKIRYEGYAQAFLLAGKKVDKNLVFWNSEISIENSLDKILNSGVQCIICSDDLICLSLMNSLKNRNIKVPEQIKVISFFDSEKLSNNEVSVTSLHIDTKEMSGKAGNLLIDVLEGKQVENRNIAKCSVIYRNSSC